MSSYCCADKWGWMILESLANQYKHNSIRKCVLKLINKFSKVARYRINIKPSMSLYTVNKLSKKEIKKITTIIIATDRIKHLEINLAKEVKNLYTGNCKILKKEMNEQLTKGNN